MTFKGPLAKYTFMAALAVCVGGVLVYTAKAEIRQAIEDARHWQHPRVQYDPQFYDI